MTSTELKKRAIALAEKTKIDSVTPEEVGQLSNDIVEYIENVEVNGSSLGIRKTYTSVSAMEADSTAPKDDKGALLRRGMLVNIYNQEDPDSADNGKVFSFQNPGWAFRGTVDAGYATKDEVTELTTEYNVSVFYPNGGIGGTDRYTLETAIAMIPASMRHVGIRCSFLNEGSMFEVWELQSSNIAKSNWVQVNNAAFKAGSIFYLEKGYYLNSQYIDYINSVVKDIRISRSLIEKISDYASPIKLCFWQILKNYPGLGNRISISILKKDGTWNRSIYLYADDITDGYLHNDDYTAEAWVDFTVPKPIGKENEQEPFYHIETNGVYIKNCVIYDAVADKAVTSDKLADKAVTSDKLADKAVTSDKLADKFLPNYTDLFVLSESISSSRRKNAEKYCQIVNRLVKRLYIDFSTISDDYIKDENGLPSLFLRQIMYNPEGDGNRYTLWLTVERTDGSVTSGIHFYSSDILVGIYSQKAGIRSSADLDYRVFPLLSDDRGQVYYSPYKEILLNLSALENFPLTGKSDSELRDSAYLENIFSADSIAKKNPSYGVYNTSGKITESTSNGGVFMEVNENYSYKILGMLENTYVGNAWKGLVLYYSDVPHVEDYSELFLGVGRMSFDSTGAIFTPLKGAKIAYFYTTNADRYYITRIDHVEFPRSVKPLEDYTMFVLGDSLSMNGQWATKVAELTGIQYSQALNNKAGAALSVGGTSMGGNNTTCGFMRCRTLIEQNYIQNAGEGFIVVLQNVNDGAWTFDDTSRTFRADNYITDNPVLVEEFNSGYLSSIPDEDRHLNTVLQVLQKSDGKILTIDNLPTKEGDVTIKVGWSGPGIRSYNVHVVPQSNDEDTLRYVLDRILEYDYTGITDIEGEDERSVIFAHGHVDSYPITLNFTDTGGTGMTCSISDTSNAKYVILKFFAGNNLESDWSDTSKWLDRINTSSAWKSIIEWLQTLYPKLKIFIMNAPAISKTKNDYLMENGLYDSKRFNDDLESSRTKRLSSLQGVADYYYLTLIDVWGHCGIHLNNLTEYYNETANVHPKDAGYERWGEYIASVLCRELPNKF